MISIIILNVAISFVYHDHVCRQMTPTKFRFIVTGTRNLLWDKFQSETNPKSNNKLSSRKQRV